MTFAEKELILKDRNFITLVIYRYEYILM